MLSPYGLDGPIGESSAIAFGGLLVHKRRAGDENGTVETGLGDGVEQVARAERVETQRALGLRPRGGDVGEAREVVHRTGPERRDLARDGVAIEQVDRAPSDAGILGGSGPARRVRPRRDFGVMFEEMLDEMAAGEPCRAGNERDARHGADVSSAGRTGLRSTP